jgi:hypothetical protein
MLPGMGKLTTLVVLFITFAANVAFAEESPQISSSSPTNGLPAISSDGKSFVRPVRVQPSGCSGTQTFAEIGTIGGPSTETKSELLVVRDECGKGASQADKNIEKVNKLLGEKSYKSVGTVQTLALPASIELPGGTFKVDATGGLTCAVGVEGSSTDRWSVTLDGEITEVRGWYTGKNASGAGYVAIEVSTDCDDTGKRGRERWIDFWPAGTTATSDGSAPIDVAASWLAALKAKDAKALASVSSTPFWKAGFTPVSGKQAKKCKKQQKAKNEKQLKGVAACMALAGNLYTRFSGDQNYLSEIDMSEFPVELKKHKKKIAKLIKANHKMVRYFLNDQGYYINLVFILDPDTDYQTVVVVLESVELEDEE